MLNLGIISSPETSECNLKHSSSFSWHIHPFISLLLLSKTKVTHTDRPFILQPRYTGRHLLYYCPFLWTLLTVNWAFITFKTCGRFAMIQWSGKLNLFQRGWDILAILYQAAVSLTLCLFRKTDVTSKSALPLLLIWPTNSSLELTSCMSIIHSLLKYLTEITAAAWKQKR